jgi:type I restriction enzyme S subunit
LPVKLPPLEQQRAIAHILGTLDDKIELNRRMNQTLEEIARAIFKSWFVDFDPVRKKAAGKKTGLPEDIDKLFPEGFERSELGEIPKGWRVGPLDDLLVLQRGFDLPKAVRFDRPYPLIADSGQDGTNDEAKVKGPGVVTGRSGKLGITTFVQEDFWPLNTTLLIKDYKISNPYHAYLLLQALGFERFNAGSAVPTPNRNHIYSMRLVIPPSIIAGKFASLIKPTFNLCLAAEKQIEGLSQLRDTLLPRLLSGSLVITDSKLVKGTKE